VPFWRPRGCVLWLDFLEPKGDTVYDKSGYDNHGTIYGAMRVRALGRRGLFFDGVDDYVKVPYSSSLDIADELTLEVILRTSTLPSLWVDIVAKRGAGKCNYSIFQTPGGDIRFEIFDGTYSPTANGGFLTDGKWHHTVGVRANGKVKIFVEGKLVHERDDTTVAPIINPDISILLGTRPAFPVFFKDNIAFIRVYNRALSEREIRANYAYVVSHIKRAV